MRRKSLNPMMGLRPIVRGPRPRGKPARPVVAAVIVVTRSVVIGAVIIRSVGGRRSIVAGLPSARAVIVGRAVPIAPTPVVIGAIVVRAIVRPPPRRTSLGLVGCDGHHS